MSRVWVFVVAMGVAAQLAAQSTAGSKDITIQVSPAQAWVDTGLDLQAGDVVKISASQTSSAPSACNAMGLPTGASDSGVLPLPTAAAGALIARLHGVNSVPVLSLIHI